MSLFVLRVGRAPVTLHALLLKLEMGDGIGLQKINQMNQKLTLFARRIGASQHALQMIEVVDQHPVLLINHLGTRRELFSPIYHVKNPGRRGSIPRAKICPSSTFNPGDLPSTDFLANAHLKLRFGEQPVICSNSPGGAARVISMSLVTSNKSKQLLQIRYLGEVRLEELQRGREDLLTQLGELAPGFRLLADFSQLESMALDCAPVLGQMMDLMGKAGVSLVARVITDPSKDIGMNILTVFHYPHGLRVVTGENLTDAARALGFKQGPPGADGIFLPVPVRRRWRPGAATGGAGRWARTGLRPV